MPLSGPAYYALWIFKGYLKKGKIHDIKLIIHIIYILNLNFTSIYKEAVNFIIFTDRWQNIIPNVDHFQERNTFMAYIISHCTLLL